MCCSVVCIIPRRCCNVKKLDNSQSAGRISGMSRCHTLFLLVLLVVGLSSCVCHTSASLMDSCTYHAYEPEKSVQPKVFIDEAVKD